MSHSAKQHWTSLACSAALLCVASLPASAAEPLAPMRVVQVGEVQCISGGASRAERRELEERTVDFRLRVNFVAKDPEAQLKRVLVRLKRQGEAARAINLTAAGPLLLVDMPSGTYTLSASTPGAPSVESQFELQPGEIEHLDVHLDTASL